MRIGILAAVGISSLLVTTSAFAQSRNAPDDEEYEEYSDEEYEEEEEEVEAAPTRRRERVRRHRRPRGERVRGPRTIPTDGSQPAPPGYYLKKKSLVAVWATGIPVLAVGYVVSLATSAIGAADDCWDGCHDGPWGVGLIPLVGSLANAANDDFSEGARIAYGFATVLQTAGFVMVVAGASIRKSVWVRQRYYSQNEPKPAEEALIPDVSFGPGWIGVSGKF